MERISIHSTQRHKIDANELLFVLTSVVHDISVRQEIIGN